MMGIFSKYSKFKSWRWEVVFFGTTLPALILFIMGEDFDPWIYIVAFGLFFVGLLSMFFGSEEGKNKDEK